MTAHVVLTCDGTRDGQPCPGYYQVPPHRDAHHAAQLARNAGWRLELKTQLCPADGHDEDTAILLTVETIPDRRTVHLQPGDTSTDDQQWNQP
ncbi:MAG: hypothetical protein ACJ768_25555 [Gaiellaceae bacterium]